MKKLLIILLSFLLFFNSSLFIIIYSVKIISISREMDEKMQILNSDELTNDMVLIRVPLENQTLNNTLQKINSTEIIYDGFLYDIATERIIGDSVYMFCVQDNEENELIKNFASHFENQGNKNPEIQYFNLLVEFLSNALVPNDNLNIPMIDMACCSFLQEYPVLNEIRDIPSPPPRLMV